MIISIFHTWSISKCNFIGIPIYPIFRHIHFSFRRNAENSPPWRRFWIGWRVSARPPSRRFGHAPALSTWPRSSNSSTVGNTARSAGRDVAVGKSTRGAIYGLPWSCFMLRGSILLRNQHIWHICPYLVSNLSNAGSVTLRVEHFTHWVAELRFQRGPPKHPFPYYPCKVVPHS